MGDPKRLRAHYQNPRHPWEKERIETEKKLLREYSLKNKKELWKLTSKIKGWADQAKSLIAATGEQAEKEKQQLFDHLKRLGVAGQNPQLDDVLSMGVRNLLDRRLQTVVFKSGLARSQRQARQFITHRHIKVGGKIVTSPNYLVSLDEEKNIDFIKRSPLSKVGHPERGDTDPNAMPKKPEKKKEDKKETKTEEKPAEDKSEEKEEKAEKGNESEEKKDSDDKTEEKSESKDQEENEEPKKADEKEDSPEEKGDSEE